MNQAGTTCDIFCRVVDNFGDVGVAWRLARQLVQEYRFSARLIVDDLASFSRIEPAVDISRESQEIRGITVIVWDRADNLEPAELVIEAFAVNIPTSYIASMAAKVRPPIWINLEYLSAEPWVGKHHLLPSPHPTLPLTKYFFFPGFAPDTGGLIRECKLLADRDRFSKSCVETELRVFLFSYANAARDNLIQAMCESGKSVRCTIPDLALATNHARGTQIQSDVSSDVSIVVLPFSAQPSFDQLLWRQHVLFVRGEDSFVRAQWAARPFIWHVYPQSEGTHWIKLNAFLLIYCDGLEGEVASSVRELWRAWNAEDRENIGAAWLRYMEHLPTLQAHAEAWSIKLAQMPDLVANLLSFYQKNTKIESFAGPHRLAITTPNKFQDTK